MATVLPDGKYQVIVVNACHKEDRQAEFAELTMIVTVGKYKYESIKKCYYYNKNITPFMLSEFSKMGVMLKDGSDMDKELMDVVGRLLIIGVYTKDGHQRYRLIQALGFDYELGKYSKDRL